MHSIITRINITVIVDYLHVFNIFMMNLTRKNGSEKKLDIFLTWNISFPFSNKRLPLKNEQYTMPT